MVYSFVLQPVDERMYLLLENDRALMIDPFPSVEADGMLKKHSVKEVLILLTHEHYDHIMGVDYYRERFNGRVLCSRTCGERIRDSKANLSARYEIFYLMNKEDDQEAYRRMCSAPFTTHADDTFQESIRFGWGDHSVHILETPGHSPGSCCIVIDRTIVFTGDSLVNGFPTITRYPGGNKAEFEQITIPFLNGLTGDCMIYPGHGESARRAHWGRL